MRMISVDHDKQIFYLGDQILNKPDKIRKSYFIPRFCSAKVPTYDAILALWGIQKPEMNEDRSGAAHKRRSIVARRARIGHDNRRRLRGKCGESPLCSGSKDNLAPPNCISIKRMRGSWDMRPSH